MLGIMIGTAAILGTAYVLHRTRRRYYGGRGCGYGHHRRWHDHHGHHGHHHHCHGHDPYRGGYGDARGWNDPRDDYEGRYDDYRRRGPSWGQGFGRGFDRGSVAERWAGMLAWQLDATPEQAEVIRTAFREVHDELHTLRDEGRATRDDLGKALAGERFDEELLGHIFARHDERLTNLRRSLVDALAKVHDVLRPEQRERLVRLLGHRKFGPGWI
jgi:Spy/CpxP family protein refolding chaperone